MLRALDLSAEEKAAVRYLSFLTLKPTMYIANVNEDGFENNPYLDQVREIAAKEGSVFRFVLLLKQTLPNWTTKSVTSLCRSLLEEPGLNRVIRAGYKLLNLQTYFTAGVKEVRAWTIPVGATAPQAAGKIHTDFEKALSVHKPSRLKISSLTKVNKAQKKQAKCVQKAKITSLKMAM